MALLNLKKKDKLGFSRSLVRTVASYLNICTQRLFPHKLFNFVKLVPKKQFIKLFWPNFVLDLLKIHNGWLVPQLPKNWQMKMNYGVSLFLS